MRHRRPLEVHSTRAIGKMNWLADYFWQSKVWGFELHRNDALSSTEHTTNFDNDFGRALTGQ